MPNGWFWWKVDQSSINKFTCSEQAAGNASRGGSGGGHLRRLSNNNNTPKDHEGATWLSIFFLALFLRLRPLSVSESSLPSLPSCPRNMSQPSQQALLAALAVQSSRPRPTTIPYSSLGPSEVKSEDTNVNVRKLHCPRKGCGSVLLQPGVGVWADMQASVVCYCLYFPALSARHCPANAQFTNTWPYSSPMIFHLRSRLLQLPTQCGT